jgi:Zn-dependent membrane protease YugP
MGNVLAYTLLMAGITFAIGFFVAFVIKMVFNAIQKMMRTQTVEFKASMLRVRHTNRIRKHNNLQTINSASIQLRNGSFSKNDETSKLHTNEIVEYYYGKS